MGWSERCNDSIWIREHASEFAEYDSVIPDPGVRGPCPRSYTVLEAWIREPPGNGWSRTSRCSTRPGAPVRGFPADCQQGWCTTCAAELPDGEVDQSLARRYFDADEEPGLILTCVARPRSD